jgi:hypothetical protein
LDFIRNCHLNKQNKLVYNTRNFSKRLKRLKNTKNVS